MVSRVIDLLDLYIPKEGFTSLPLGGQDWNRTRNLLITSELHCQLCYLAKLVSRGFEPLNAYYYAIMRAR